MKEQLDSKQSLKTNAILKKKKKKPKKPLLHRQELTLKKFNPGKWWCYHF